MFSIHNIAIKKLSALLRKITSNYDDNFYCLNYLHSFRIKNKIKSLISTENLIRYHLLFMQISNL